MSENPRRNEWQVVGAVALIALGALLLLEQIRLPWLGLLEEAFARALQYVWPIAIIALGAILLITARREHGASGYSQSQQGEHRLYRSRSDRMLGGVLGGLAQYLGVDSTWVRIIFVVLSVFSGFGTGVLIYVIGLIFIPEEPRDFAPQTNWPTTPSWGTGSDWKQSATETVQTPAAPTPPPYQPPVPPVRQASSAPTAADAPPPPEPPAPEQS